ncbi:MAG: type IV pilus twitching motility protein PilT [Vulcanimicrobiaceae bacterium]
MFTMSFSDTTALLETIARLRKTPGASDIHLDANEPAAVRIDGDLTLVPNTNVPLDTITDFLTQIDERNPINNEAQREARGVYVQIHDSPDTGRLRISVYRTTKGSALAIRLLPDAPPNLNSLSLPDAVHMMVEKRSGLGILSGPNGVGKSTTLAAITQRIADDYKCVIYTLDEGQEYVYNQGRSRVRQMRVGKGLDAPSYVAALDGMLVGNPDIVVVSECRTPEAIMAALMLAETGVRVLITLHIDSATAVVDRVIGAFPPAVQPSVRVMLANVLDEVMYMRLPKRIERTDAYGRVPACEILWRTQGLAESILAGQAQSTDADLVNYITTNRPVGMCLIENSLARLVEEKVISKEEAYRHALRPERLQSLIGDKQTRSLEIK